MEPVKYRVRYVGLSLDGVDVPSLDLQCGHGETIAAASDDFVLLCAQPANWEPADDESAAFLAEFCAYLADVQQPAADDPPAASEVTAPKPRKPRGATG